MVKKRLRVFVDAEVLIAPHFSGIGHYTLELLRGMDRLLDDQTDVEVTLGVFYRRVNKIRAYGFRNFRIKRTLFPLRISNALKIHNWQPPYDIFFGRYVYLFPNFTTWPLWFSKAVSIIYDLSYEFFPEYVEPRNQRFLSDNVKRTVGRSDHIVTISSNSQKEIMDFYKLPKEKVSIVYPGVDQTVFFRRPLSEIKKVKARYGIHGDYILFIGNIEPRKNLKSLLLAYEKLPAAIRRKYSLLLVGARGWLDDEIFEIIERQRIMGNHIQQPLDYVEDDDRPAITSGASLFVYPSLYEGFGMPPLEAMACGVPVISSNNSSLPEAVGPAAEQIDALDIDQLNKSIVKVLGDEPLRQQMIQAGFDQVDRYSWDKEAQKLLKILEDVNL